MNELRIETITMSAAPLGPENPLPDLVRRQEVAIEPKDYCGFPPEILTNMAYGRVSGCLPYTLQDGYTRTRRRRSFQVAVLENDLFKATFLFELGGRLWSLIHKPSERELLAVNPVFQPANLAIRNAWFRGGVEWNIGIHGHSPLTCSDLFAGRVDSSSGAPVLRLWEWERIRQTPFQIDAWLPDSWPVLLVRVCISNPNSHSVPMYWWSNTAIPETDRTRVVVPADSAYSFGYGRSGPTVAPLPRTETIDITYPTNLDRAADFFYRLPIGQRPWICALDEDGAGLFQTSTALLKGRKLFVWGMGRGGRRWQRFLSTKQRAYIEIQAGLTATQAEHIPMPAGAVWEWVEAYGLMQANPALVHGQDWQQTRRAVQDIIEQLVPTSDLEQVLEQSRDMANSPPEKKLHMGSGWGALEERRRQIHGQPKLGKGFPFDDTSLGEAQAPWLTLLKTGRFGDADPKRAPLGYMVQEEWWHLLEQAAATGAGATWFAWLHLGVMRYANADHEGARRAWEQSLAVCDTPWARRNLALLAHQQGRLDDAVALYTAACRLRPELLPLAAECGRFLVDNGRAAAWLTIVREVVPRAIRDRGRIRLLTARAALAAGELEYVEEVLAQKLVLEDLREGERALSELWYDYHTARISSEERIPIDAALRKRVHSQFPVPARFDFRMSQD